MELRQDMAKFAYLTGRKTLQTVLIIQLFRQTLEYGISEHTSMLLGMVGSLCIALGATRVRRMYSDQATNELSRSYSPRPVSCHGVRECLHFR